MLQILEGSEGSTETDEPNKLDERMAQLRRDVQVRFLHDSPRISVQQVQRVAMDVLLLLKDSANLEDSGNPRTENSQPTVGLCVNNISPSGVQRR